MCTCTQRNPIFCVVPPYVLRRIAKEMPSSGAADAALRTLATDSTFRAMRASHTADPTRRAPGAAEPGLNRTIYTADNQELLPGRIIRAEGGPEVPGDLPANEAYDGLGATYNFFDEMYGRNSIDDEGMPLEATVHYGAGYDNAFWNGQRMVFGDGDGELFNRFTIAVDIIAHELAHGVTEDEAGLLYQFQSGALNESMSDVFGSLIKQYLKHQKADQADWLIGEGLFTSAVQGVALRSMKEPGTAFDDPVIGKDPQPGHMRDYVNTYQDNGGVHINSGIPNKAFYLVATKLGGYAWEKAGRIWYETLRDSRLRPNTGFRRFSTLTQAVAVRLYGGISMEAKAVKEAWAEVGLRAARAAAAGQPS